uniref:type II secretion system F family protein n=1 Tax=Mariniphaga sediminis TaxID=1628158 RepID=UPI0035672B86
MLEIVIPEIKEARSNNKKKNFWSHVTSNDYMTWINGYEKFSNKNKKILFDDLSILLSSGVNLVAALDLVLNSFKGKKEKTLIQSFIIDLTNGKSFFEVLQNSNKFSPYEFYSIKIGEETGKLPIILIELSKYISQRIEQRRKVVGAFSYPVVILLTAIIAVA